MLFRQSKPNACRAKVYSLEYCGSEYPSIHLRPRTRPRKSKRLGQSIDHHNNTSISRSGRYSTGTLIPGRGESRVPLVICCRNAWWSRYNDRLFFCSLSLHPVLLLRIFIVHLEHHDERTTAGHYYCRRWSRWTRHQYLVCNCRTQGHRVRRSEAIGRGQ